MVFFCVVVRRYIYNDEKGISHAYQSHERPHQPALIDPATTSCVADVLNYKTSYLIPFSSAALTNDEPCRQLLYYSPKMGGGSSQVKTITHA